MTPQEYEEYHYKLSKLYGDLVFRQQMLCVHSVFYTNSKQTGFALEVHEENIREAELKIKSILDEIEQLKKQDK